MSRPEGLRSFPFARLCIHYLATHTLAVTKEMKLMPSAGSDRALVWTVQADFADEEAKVEQLAIRFKNSESKKPNNYFCHVLHFISTWCCAS